MKISLGVLCGTVETLLKIKSMGLGVKVNYWCTKNLKSFETDYRFFMEQRNELYNRYCFKGEDGLYYRFEDQKVIFNIKEENMNEFGEQIQALMTNDCEFEPFIMQESLFESLPNFDISETEYDSIGFLLP